MRTSLLTTICAMASAACSLSVSSPPAPASPKASTTSVDAASTASSPRAYVHFDCGTHIGHASPPLLDTIHDLHQATLNGTAPPTHNTHLSTRAAAAVMAIDVYIHVVTTAAHVGIITPAQVKAQVLALNAAYNTHGIVFTLRGSDYTSNDAWAIGASPADDMAMKTALRKGTYASLNLYFQTDLAGGVLGKCTLPTSVGIKPLKSAYAVDGCNIAAGTVPQGPIYGYNQGKTAVHETGHWLGLLHTFEGYSCVGNGDFVVDTPMESQSTDGCPVSPAKNTCGSVRAGTDPIHNYMDYSTDACYVRFTVGQEQRMKTLWEQFRKGN